MKKNLFAIMMLALVAVSCEKNDDNDASDNLRVLTFEGDSWSSLIDTPEYDGSLLYSTTTQYTWTDTDNTFLSGCVNESYSEYQFWSGGIAISNYYKEVVSGTAVDFNNQLSVSNGSAGAAGNGGSANFAVIYDAAVGGWGAPSTYLSFGDNTARTIDHLYISSISYLESEVIASDFSATDTFTVTATGYDADDVKTGSTTYDLAVDGALVEGWNKWDLSSLGDVVKVEFSITSTYQPYGYMSLPAYCAIDDVAVVFE